jgi:hypothetical protein
MSKLSVEEGRGGGGGGGGGSTREYITKNKNFTQICRKILNY